MLRVDDGPWCVWHWRGHGGGVEVGFVCLRARNRLTRPFSVDLIFAVRRGRTIRARRQTRARESDKLTERRAQNDTPEKKRPQRNAAAVVVVGKNLECRKCDKGVQVETKRKTNSAHTHGKARSLESVSAPMALLRYANTSSYT